MTIRPHPSQHYCVRCRRVKVYPSPHNKGSKYCEACSPFKKKMER